MGSMGIGTEAGEQEQFAGMPEDVAALYSWAKLQDITYRDFSGSRREHRAQVRLRTAQEVRDRELKAKGAAEAAAAQAESEASAAEARLQDFAKNPKLEPASETQATLSSEVAAATQRAAAQRAKAARHADAAAQAAVVMQREEREVADAHASAERQTRNYAEWSLRLHTPARAQSPEEDAAAVADATSSRLLHLTGRTGSATQAPGTPGPLEAKASTAPAALATPTIQAESSFALDLSRNAATLRSARTSDAAEPTALSLATGTDTAPTPVAPAWLYDAPRTIPTPTPSAPAEAGAPLLAVFSMDGGVGKAGVVATLGRALAAQGERIVLADTTSHGLLPFYFGAREIHSGVVRSFPAASGAIAEPLSLVSYDVSESSNSQAKRQALVEEILGNCEGNHRLLLDISAGSNWVVRRIAGQQPVLLVPIAIDGSGPQTVEAVDRVFQDLIDPDGHPIQPYYLLHQFDASLPLHLEVRDSMRRQLQDRLVPVAIRRSAAVNKALAEGMTVIDYAPEALVSRDYLEVAAWLRGVSPSAFTATLAARSAP
jgi:cellulose synthase operon protein YhjQ